MLVLLSVVLVVVLVVLSYLTDGQIIQRFALCWHAAAGTAAAGRALSIWPMVK